MIPKKKISSRSKERAAAGRAHTGSTVPTRATPETTAVTARKIISSSTTTKNLQAPGSRRTLEQVRRKETHSDVDAGAAAGSRRRPPLLGNLPLTLPAWPEEIAGAEASAPGTKSIHNSSHSNGLDPEMTTTLSASPLNSGGGQSRSRKSNAHSTSVFCAAEVSGNRQQLPLLGRRTLNGKNEVRPTVSGTRLQRETFWKDAKNRHILRTITKSLDTFSQDKGRRKRKQAVRQDAESKGVSSAQRGKGQKHKQEKMETLKENTALDAASTWIREQMNSTRQRRPLITLERLLRQKRKPRRTPLH